MKQSITIVLLFIHLITAAQHQERTVFVYNVAFGGFTAGIGSVINKPKTVNWKTAFVRGLWQGSIGGLVNYSGKRMSYLINKENEPLYAWPAKLLHAAGYSMIQNASAYEPFLQNWTMDLGLLRFDYSLQSKKIKARLLPEALVSTIIAAHYGRFDFATSVKTGEIIFKTYNLILLPIDGAKEAQGVTFGRSIVYAYGPQATYSKGRILSHEIIHRFQYNEYQVFNTWFKPLYCKLETKKIGHIFSKYVYADIPYFIIPYSLSKQSYNHYYKNFYEFEAQRFSTNAFVPR